MTASIPAHLQLALYVAASVTPLLAVRQALTIAHRRFRDTLWRIRDDLALDIRRSAVSGGPATMRLMELVESHVEEVKRHSLADVWVAYLITGTDDQLGTSPERALGCTIPDQDRAHLVRYFQELVDAYRRYLSRGSVSGWLACLSFRIIRVVKAVRRGRRRAAVPAQGRRLAHKDLLVSFDVSGGPGFSAANRNPVRSVIGDEAISRTFAGVK